MSEIVVSPLTLSLDTNIYANNDLLADTQELANAVKVIDGWGMIESLTVIDADDVGQAFSVFVMNTSTSFGTENSAPNISDANILAGTLGYIPVAAADYVDIGGAKVATVRNVKLAIKPVSGGTSIYVAVVNGTGTPTYTAAGVSLKFGIVQG